MKQIYSVLLVIVFLMSACQKGNQEKSISQSTRIITAGGTITEIVAALGFKDQIIATDITSTYPEGMQDLPSIGYRNQIKTEGLLSMDPDFILYESGYLTEEVVQQLQETGIKTHGLDKPKDVDGTRSLIKSLASTLGVTEEGNKLIASLEKDLVQLQALTSNDAATKPRICFVMARGPETIFLGGKGTFAESFITLAGGEFLHLNIEDFKPLSPEALPAMNPDYILLFESSFQSMGGMNGLAQIQGIQATEAWKKQQIIAMDGNLISGFGPRVAQAAMELFEKTQNKN